MMETKFVGNNYKMLVTALAILVTNIHFFTLASGTNIQKLSPTLIRQHHYQQKFRRNLENSIW